MNRKNLLAILMAGTMLVTIAGALSVNAAYVGSSSGSKTTSLGFNIGIESVTYTPNPPKKNQDITFSVKLFAENWDRGVLVYYSLDGAEYPIPYPSKPSTNPDGSPNFAIQYCTISFKWPDDTNSHTVRIRIDCGIPGGDSNPADDVWSMSIKAKTSMISSVSSSSQLFLNQVLH